MPAGLVRYQQTGNMHHVNFCCFHRQANFSTPAARDLFEVSLERMRQRYGFWVTAYVVMPDHVHLLVSEPRKGSLATAIQALKLSVAVQSEARPFWQKRYFDRNVWSEGEWVKTRRYIHQNPVRSGLVACAAEWKWSSFNHWMTGCDGVVEIELPGRRGGGVGWGWYWARMERQRRYRRE